MHTECKITSLIEDTSFCNYIHMNKDKIWYDNLYAVESDSEMDENYNITYTKKISEEYLLEGSP